MTAHAVAGVELDLTGMERSVLAHLLLNTGAVVTKADLHAAVYPIGAVAVESNVMEVIVSRLRRKILLAKAGIQIATVRGKGYRLDPLQQAEPVAAGAAS